jgi:hypothetical protein
MPRTKELLFVRGVFLSDQATAAHLLTVLLRLHRGGPD